MKTHEELNTIKEMYATKAFLASLLCEYCEEFKGMYIEEIKNRINEVQVSSNLENKHDVNFTVTSPNLLYNHEIVVCLEIRLIPEISNDKLPIELEHTLKMHLERKMEHKDKTIISYSFWFYLNPSLNNQDTQTHYAATINSIGNDYFEDEKSEVFIINLGNPSAEHRFDSTKSNCQLVEYKSNKPS